MSNLTERAIKQSMMKLLNERPLRKITVKDIVEDCDINRNTFYYHYKDIRDVIEDIIKEEMNQIIDQHSSIDTLEEGIKLAISFSLKNKDAVLNIYNSIQRELYEKYLWDLLDYLIRTLFGTVFSHNTLRSNDEEIVMNFYKCSCFGLITSWLENGMPEKKLGDFYRLCELIKGQDRYLIEKCEK